MIISTSLQKLHITTSHTFRRNATDCRLPGKDDYKAQKMARAKMAAERKKAMILSCMGVHQGHEKGSYGDLQRLGTQQSCPSAPWGESPSW
jgi:hypothetical protein